MYVNSQIRERELPRKVVVCLAFRGFAEDREDINRVIAEFTLVWMTVIFRGSNKVGVFYFSSF